MHSIRYSRNLDLKAQIVTNVFMYVKRNLKRIISTWSYVDDLIISTGNLEKLNDLKSFLMNKFEMVDLGEVKLFLGIKVHRDEKYDLS